MSRAGLGVGGLPGGRSVSQTIAHIQHSERVATQERGDIGRRECVSLVDTSQQVSTVG